MSVTQISALFVIGVILGIVIAAQKIRIRNLELELRATNAFAGAMIDLCMELVEEKQRKESEQ